VKEKVRVEIIGAAGTGKLHISKIISEALAAQGFDCHSVQAEAAQESEYPSGAANLSDKIFTEIGIVQEPRLF